MAPDTTETGKRLGLAVAGEHRDHLTVVAPRKDSATYHPELAKLDIVTERSGFAQDGGVVLAWCPTYQVMEKVQRLKHSVVVLVEWIPGEFDAWATLVGAYNVVTGQVMSAGLSAETSKALEGIVSEGYNGWTKSTVELLTLSYLKDLEAAGTYNRELVLAYARQFKSEESIVRLKRLLNKLESSNGQPLATSGSDFPTSSKWQDFSMTLTALHRYLGDPPGPLTDDVIERTIAQGFRETDDLDWKSELPPLGAITNSDFPKDVAAIANNGGGTLVFGITEAQKAATGRKDVGEPNEGYQRALLSAAVTAISPPIFGLEVVPLGEPGSQCVVVVVPPSVDGPHLIYRNDYFGAPIRRLSRLSWNLRWRSPA